MVLRELTALRGVSGNEAAVRDYILERIRPLADVRIDRMGNLIAHKKGTEGARARGAVRAHGRSWADGDRHRR